MRRWALGACLALAAILRFGTIDAKGFWEDEAETALILKHDFAGMLAAVRDIGTTPPLYYIVLRFWSKLFGAGEIGLRSFSALVGLAVVPLAYLIGRELVSERAGLVAALLVAVNPILIWYSQEARSYSLLVLLTTAGLLFFVRALKEPSRRNLGLWALFSGLAVPTHYFGLFPFAAEGAWLALLPATRRRLLLPAAGGAVLVLAVLPYLIKHSERVGSNDWISRLSLGKRVLGMPAIFLVGFETAHPYLAAAVAAVLAGLALWLLLRRGEPGERQGALVGAVVGGAVLTMPIGLALLNRDYFEPKNVLPALVPLLLVLGAGIGARRARPFGAVVLAGLCALSLVIVLSTAWLPKFGGRDDWRSAAKAIGPAPTPRALVVTPGGSSIDPLTYYLPGTIQLARPARVSQIDVVALPRRALGSSSRPKLPRLWPGRPAPAPGFRLVMTRRGKHYELLVYRSPRPRRVTEAQLMAARLQDAKPVVFLQPGPERYFRKPS